MSTWTDDRGRRHVGIMVAGRRVHRILPEGATASDAKQLEADLRAAVGRQRSPVIPGDPAMAAIMQGYSEHADTLRSPATAKYHATRIGPWAAMYRASQARECAAHIVRDLLKPMLQPDGVTKKPAYAPATVNRSLNAMKKALKLAWERGETPENYGLRIKSVPENNAREVYLSIEQVAVIASHCTAPAQAAIWAALLTGARRGEILKVKREHIHENRIDIPAGNTKTLRTRSVPIVPALRPWLKHFPLAMNYEGLKSSFRRARERAGMPHVHFHDLRHSCASILIGLNVDLYTVGEILGHSNTQTTKRYAHLQLDRKAAALGKLSSLVMPTPAGKKVKAA
jgi:integrase